MNTWQLEELIRSFDRVDNSELSREEALALLEQAYVIESWLTAERNYRYSVSQWLSAEKRWRLTKDLLKNNAAYKAAERGWRKMRELCANLDGVDEFHKLSPVLQDRYAVFAAAALGIGSPIQVDGPNNET